MSIYGLLGEHLAHSYSAQIHSLLGCDDYRLIEVPPHKLEDFFTRGDISGLNITIPYKKRAMELCSRLSGSAVSVGCVNTVVRDSRGELCGFNTDICGFEYMAKRANISFEGRRVVIFGSGGASLTAQAAAKKQGASDIAVISRNGDDNYSNLERHYDAQILVNTTPVGMYPHTGSAPADIALFPECEGVIDVIYNPRRTKFIMRAEELGIPNTDGLPMLVEQARAAEELFRGSTIPESETERIISLIRCQMQNIVLTGMPGSGKSTLGRLVSALSGKPVIDIDDNIVRAAGMSIPDIFKLRGEKAFRELERERVQISGMESGHVIVTGGGVVTQPENYAPLHQNSRVYHIERRIDMLARAGRPLSEGADLGKMYSERLPLYERFRDAVIYNNSSPDEAANAIWRDFCENSCN